VIEFDHAAAVPVDGCNFAEHALHGGGAHRHVKGRCGALIKRTSEPKPLWNYEVSGVLSNPKFAKQGPQMRANFGFETLVRVRTVACFPASSVSETGAGDVVRQRLHNSFYLIGIINKKSYLDPD
jgi:hypothetical protein